MALTTDSTPAGPPLTTNMKSAVALLAVFAVTIVLAFSITIATGTAEMRMLAVGAIVPITALDLVFIYYCRKRRLWAYAGGLVLGVVGMALRVVVSTQPSLEVGGGLPVGVTVLYIVLGALVALKSYESMLDFRG
jgi:hypothetical protein